MARVRGNRAGCRAGSSTLIFIVAAPMQWKRPLAVPAAHAVRVIVTSLFTYFARRLVSFEMYASTNSESDTTFSRNTEHQKPQKSAIPCFPTSPSFLSFRDHAVPGLRNSTPWADPSISVLRGRRRRSEAPATS